MEDSNLLTGATFLFLGRSACGKGTQAHFLERTLTEQGVRSLYVYSGDTVRQMARMETPTGKFVAEVLRGGKLPGDWLGTYVILKQLIEGLDSPDLALIVDGSPRRILEAEILDRALEDLGRTAPIPILIDVSRSECRRRLKTGTRGRSDDANSKAVESRLDFFDTDVKCVIDHYRSRGLITVDGAGDKAAVFERLLRQLIHGGP